MAINDGGPGWPASRPEFSILFHFFGCPQNVLKRCPRAPGALGGHHAIPAFMPYAPAGAKAPAAATIAAAATWPDFSDGNLGPDSTDDIGGGNIGDLKMSKIWIFFFHPKIAQKGPPGPWRALGGPGGPISAYFSPIFPPYFPP